jgi:hypothetical protein
MKDSPKSFDQFLHPYIFVLQEGREIHKNFLDYSLLLLQVGQPDILPAPNRAKTLPTPIIQFTKK